MPRTMILETLFRSLNLSQSFSVGSWSQDGSIVIVKELEASDVVVFMDKTLEVKSLLSASINFRQCPVLY